MEYNLTKKQMDVYTDVAREVCIYGGIRSGKTQVMLLKCIAAASHPQSRVGLFRKTLVSLKLTTLKSLLEGDGMTKPVLPHGSYIHNQSEKTITLKGGGTIVYSSLEEPERIRGLTLNSCFIDEATDLEINDYITLAGRVSAKTKDVPMQIVSSCNSKSPHHWIAKRFNITQNIANTAVNKTENRSAHLLNPCDNPYLPQAYLEMLESWRGSLAYERDVLGKWVSADGLVYSDYDFNKHVIDVKPECVKYYMGVDCGYTDAFVVLLAGVNQDGDLFIVDEFYKTKMNEASQVAQILEMSRSVGGVEAIFVDYAGMGASLISECINNDLPARKAKKDRHSGIAKVRNRFAAKNRIRIMNTCVNLLRETSTYEYKPDSDEIKDGNDHCMDALRYLISGIDTNIGDLVLSEEKILDAKNKEFQSRNINIKNNASNDIWDDESFTPL